MPLCSLHTQECHCPKPVYLELCGMLVCAYVCILTVLCSQIPVYAYGWHHHLAVCAHHSRVVPFCRTTHMPGCSVHWPEWQLRVLGWAAGIVPFMVMADGANRDERLLQGTGREGWGGMKEAEISQGCRRKWVRGKVEKKSMIERRDTRVWEN